MRQRDGEDKRNKDGYVLKHASVTAAELSWAHVLLRSEEFLEVAIVADRVPDRIYF